VEDIAIMVANEYTGSDVMRDDISHMWSAVRRDKNYKNNFMEGSAGVCHSLHWGLA
jgi:hypothetical protein